MSSTANAASVGQIRSGLRALGESLRRGRRKVCPVLGLIEIETASKSLFSLSVQNVSVCAKSNVGTLVMYRNFVLRKGMSPQLAREQLLHTEPFNNHPDIVATLPDDPHAGG